jgi:hypothetical protein
MMAYLIYLVYTNPIIKVVLITLTGLFIILFLVFSFYCILDSLYRPNYPQYPYNVFFDRLLPSLILIFPSICVCLYIPNLVTRFTFLLFLHSLIIFLFHYWSKFRNWEHENLNTWHSPKIFKQLSIALIYPYVFGFYLLFLKYLSMGTYRNVDFENISWESVLIFFLALPNMFVWLKLGLDYIKGFRLWLWNDFVNFCYSIHIKLLYYNLYFKLLERIFKSSHRVFFLFSEKIHVLLRFSRFIPILLVVFMLLELLFTSTLYYSNYLLFYYPLIYGFIFCITCILKSDFTYDCCFSDYLHQNFSKPQYPRLFWTFFPHADEFYGFFYQFSPSEEEQIIKLSKKYSWKLRKTPMQLHNMQLSWRVRNTPLEFYGHFKHISGIRYFTSGRAEFIYNKNTYLIGQTLRDKLILINSDWRLFYTNILAQESTKTLRVPPVNQVYNNEFIHPSNNTLTLQTFIAQNTPLHFTSLMKKNVIITPYTNEFVQFKTQPSPDLLFNFENTNEFSFKGKVCMDLKNGMSTLSNSYVLAISATKYTQLLTRIYNTLIFKGFKKIHLEPIFKTLHEANVQNDFDMLYLTWVRSLPLFNDFVVPLRIPSKIAFDVFTEECKRYLELSKIRLQTISNALDRNQSYDAIIKEYYNIDIQSAADLFKK